MRKTSFTVNNASAEEENRLRELVNTLMARPIAYHPIFTDICADLHAGLMLSQMWYWKDNKAAIDRGGWFYKTRTEWYEETRLSRFQQEQARRALKRKGFIREELRGAPPKLYFAVNFSRVIDAIIQRGNQNPIG